MSKKFEEFMHSGSPNWKNKGFKDIKKDDEWKLNSVEFPPPKLTDYTDINEINALDIAREEGRIEGLNEVIKRISNRIIVNSEVKKLYPRSKLLEGCNDCLEIVKNEIILELLNKKESSNG